MTPEDTRITLSSVMRATEANLLGTIHGGNVMKLVDTAAGVSARRFAGGPAVTASMDEMSFLTPVRVGDILYVSAQVNWSGTSSMEVGVRADVERWDSGTDRIHVATAYLVMVAIDPDGKPLRVPAIELATAEDQRRHREALIRREHRLARRAAIGRSRESAS